jgi:RNA polymerase sigma-70 factor (ECF subfamily)
LPEFSGIGTRFEAQLPRGRNVDHNGRRVKAENDPDVQLMLAVQRDDDEAAFEVLFRKYVGRVAGFAATIVGSKARAEEIAQEAFVQVYRARQRYQPQARFVTWLYRIVSNLCVSEVRRPEHRFVRVTRPVGDDGREDADPDFLPDETTRSGEEDLLAQEDLGRIRALVEALPAQQRAALLLARVEGLSYEEVAQSLDCSVSAVKSLIHRATVSLRNGLHERE